MNYNTLQEAMEQVGWDQEVDALSVYRAFEQVADGRHKRGVRYSIALILTLLVLAKLAGMTSLLGIAEWVRRLSRLAAPGLARGRPALSVCDVEQCVTGRGCRASDPGAGRTCSPVLGR